MSARADKQVVLKARALAHPTRVTILRDLLRPSAAILARSPAELARDHDIAVSNVSFHMHALEELGAVKLTRTRPKRGSVEHFYRATGKVRLDLGGDEALDQIAAVLGRDWPVDIERTEAIESIIESTGRKLA
jgi:DNA-binding transcriptional ArsR family regulator